MPNSISFTSVACAAIVAATLLYSCHSNNKKADLQANKKAVAWDTVKIRAAINGYLQTHEKYYNLIDSINIWIDTLSPKQIAYDQSNYYRLLTYQTDRENQTEIVVAPGTQPSNLPPPKPNRFVDSTNFYIEKHNQLPNEPILGYWAFVRYRLSDVMLTYSDFTPYIFYFDTAYRRMDKSRFLHYTNIRLNPPNESGVYLDTPYPYIPSRQ